MKRIIILAIPLILFASFAWGHMASPILCDEGYYARGIGVDGNATGCTQDVAGGAPEGEPGNAFVTITADSGNNSVADIPEDILAIVGGIAINTESSDAETIIINFDGSFSDVADSIGTGQLPDSNAMDSELHTATTSGDITHDSTIGGTADDAHHSKSHDNTEHTTNYETSANVLTAIGTHSANASSHHTATVASDLEITNLAATGGTVGWVAANDGAGGVEWKEDATGGGGANLFDEFIADTGTNPVAGDTNDELRILGDEGVTTSGDAGVGSITIAVDHNAITNGHSDGADVATNSTHRTSDGSEHSLSHTQGSDTALGAQAEDLDMNTNYQITSLQAPAAQGEAIRQTATVTETNLNTLTGGGDTTLHDHDGMSENTTHRGSDGSDHSLSHAQSHDNTDHSTNYAVQGGGEHDGFSDFVENEHLLPATLAGDGLVDNGTALDVDANIREIPFRASWWDPVTDDNGVPMGTAAGACVVNEVRCRARTATVTIDVYNQGNAVYSGLVCAVDDTAPFTWTSQTASLTNTSVADGDELYIDVAAIGGTPTLVAVQVNCDE